MRFLLDTNALLWFLDNDKKLSHRARQLIENSSHESFCSIASLWEIAIKTGLGKLDLSKPFEQMFPAQLHLNRIELLEIGVDSFVKLAP